MGFNGANKRGRTEGGFNSNGHGGFKKSKQEMESFTTGIGSKLKPCTKFFSVSRYSFGDGCHFPHYVPSGIKAVTQIPNGPNSFTKARLCKKFQTAEGWKFGDKCNFEHGKWGLGKPAQEYDNRSIRQRFPAGFGASAMVKISIDAAVAGAVIGKCGVNSKQICRVTGVKLSVRDHESDPNVSNVELEGTFDQIKHAGQMVKEIIANIGSRKIGRSGGGGGSHFKTKMCEKFSRGLCTLGERCRFAHGEEELRKFSCFV